MAASDIFLFSGFTDVLLLEELRVIKHNFEALVPLRIISIIIEGPVIFFQVSLKGIGHQVLFLSENWIQFQSY